MTRRLFLAGSLLLLSLAVLSQEVANPKSEELDAYVGAWSGTLKTGVLDLTLVLHIGVDETGAATCTFDSPDQGAEGIVGEVVHLSSDSLMVSSKRISAVFAGHRSGDSIKGRFVQLLNGLPLTLYRGLPQLNRPQTPVPPLPYTTEEVTFTNPDAGATFAGTLTYPNGYRARRQKKVPVVLMVSGSGQQNRDEELMGHQPFRVIADYLARHGIASLRYDDRGTGQSVGGRIDSVTTADFAQDALYGLRHLRQRGFKHVGVLGHSEGGNIAFIAGARGEADFLISLAGAGVKGDTALTAQYNRTMELSGQPGRKSTAQYVASVKGKGQTWLDYFLDYDPSDDLAAIHCPVMAVNGDKDCQVLWELNLDGIQRHLPKNKRNIIKSYSGLNHLFQHCTTGAPTEYRQIEETFAVEVLDDIVQFIHQACKGR